MRSSSPLPDSTTWLLSMWLGAAACGHTVQLEIPARPALNLDTTRVAVVADTRSCRPVADTLVARLNQLDGASVDPLSHVRIHLVECGRRISTNVDVHLTSQSDRRRISLIGNAHAVVAVHAGGGIHAHLIGSARHVDFGSWGDIDFVGRQRTVDRSLTQRVVEDLVQQISPMPRLVARRVYPNASEGTARRYLHDAVQAERSGDLVEALRLARLAQERHPSQDVLAYTEELEAVAPATLPFSTIDPPP